MVMPRPRPRSLAQPRKREGGNRIEGLRHPPGQKLKVSAALPYSKAWGCASNSSDRFT